MDVRLNAAEIAVLFRQNPCSVTLVLGSADSGGGHETVHAVGRRPLAFKYLLVRGPRGRC